MKKIDLLVRAKQIVTVGQDPAPRFGKQMAQLEVLQESALAVDQGKILALGKFAEIEAKFSARDSLDFSAQCLTPGLVDPHTHLVFAGNRERDFYERLQGVSYEEIAKRGGGIRDSVRQLRKASKEELLNASLKRLRQILTHGTTTCEVKSGYGLSLEDEIKTLEVIEDLGPRQPVTLIPTFLGAHEIPDEYRGKREDYIQLLLKQMLPEVAQRKLARFCDVFCEKDVFSVEESRQILMRARDLGFGLKLHADELAEGFGGAELAAELRAISADHLVMISSRGITDLKGSATIAVLLPATTFFLGKERYAPARDLMQKGVPVALATDLNPGSSNTESLQAVMTLAAIKLKMSPEEILTAVTHNAACAIGEESRVGRLGEGMHADFVVWDLSDYRQIPYHFGGNRVARVFKNGQSVA